MSGLFITMEGIDGAGKTTQTKLLADYLKKYGFDVTCTREPGGNPISEKIRNIIIDIENKDITDLTEAFLYAASRAQLTNKVILPALKEGNIVICDRYLDSNLVYQGIARGIGEDIIMDINKYSTYNLVPDVTFFLKVTPKKGLARKKRQEKLDRIESEKFYFHKKVYDGYLEIADKYKERIITINANRDVEVIHKDIIKHIDYILAERSF